MRTEDSNVRRPRMNSKTRNADITTRATPESMGTGPLSEFRKTDARIMKTVTNNRVRMAARRPFLFLQLPNFRFQNADPSSQLIFFDTQEKKYLLAGPLGALNR